ncbi:C-_U-editing enzyme APOBEC-2b isoform X1 [Stigmatopora argus]
MADKTSRVSVKRKEKKTESKTNDEKEKDKARKQDKVGKKTDAPPEPSEAKEDKRNGEAAGAVGEQEKKSNGNGEFEPIELPPFEIVTGEQMSPFYFKFQFRNVEYSSGRNKTLLCYRVDTPGGNIEPLKGYLEDEHATAHAEEAFFQQVMCSCLSCPFYYPPFSITKFSVVYHLWPFKVLPETNASQEYEVTWYVTSSPCVGCAAKLANILRKRKKLRLCVFCSRLFEFEEPEIVEGLKAMVNAGCKLRMMKPADFQHVWDTYVEKEDQSFAPWEDCQENYNYYVEKLADILK